MKGKRGKPRLNEKQEVCLTIIEYEEHTGIHVVPWLSKNVTVHVLPRPLEMSAKLKRWTGSHMLMTVFIGENN